MKLSEYQHIVMRTSSTDRILEHAAIGLAGEAGEFCDTVKKHLIYNQELDLDNAVEEIGDILWYCALAAEAIGVSLESIAEHNIDKLKKRYPEKYSDELAKERLDKNY